MPGHGKIRIVAKERRNLLSCPTNIVTVKGDWRRVVVYKSSGDERFSIGFFFHDPFISTEQLREQIGRSCAGTQYQEPRHTLGKYRSDGSVHTG
jgi:hypothetical protein